MMVLYWVSERWWFGGRRR